MDTTKRILIKAISWQLLGIATMTILSFLFTGSIQRSMVLALMSCFVSFLFFIIHEKIWNNVGWGRK